MTPRVGGPRRTSRRARRWMQQHPCLTRGHLWERVDASVRRCVRCEKREGVDGEAGGGDA